MEKDSRKPSALADRRKMFEQPATQQEATPPPRAPVKSRASDMAKRFEAANASPTQASPQLDGARLRGSSSSGSSSSTLVSERAKGLTFNPAMLTPGSKPPPLRKGTCSSGAFGSSPSAGMGHLESARPAQMDPATIAEGDGGCGSSAGNAGDAGSGVGGGVLAPLPTASRPTRRPAGRKPKTRQQSSLAASTSQKQLSDDDDDTAGGDASGVKAGGDASDGKAGGGGGGGGPPRRLLPSGGAQPSQAKPSEDAPEHTQRPERWGTFQLSGSDVTGLPSWAPFILELHAGALHVLPPDEDPERGDEAQPSSSVAAVAAAGRALRAAIAVLPLSCYAVRMLEGVPDRVGCIELSPDSHHAGAGERHGRAWLRLPSRAAPEAQRAAELGKRCRELQAARRAAEADALAATRALLRSTLGDSQAEAAMADAMREAAYGNGGGTAAAAAAPPPPQGQPHFPPQAPLRHFPPTRSAVPLPRQPPGPVPGVASVSGQPLPPGPHHATSSPAALSSPNGGGSGTGGGDDGGAYDLGALHRSLSMRLAAAVPASQQHAAGLLMEAQLNAVAWVTKGGTLTKFVLGRRRRHERFFQVHGTGTACHVRWSGMGGGGGGGSHRLIRAEPSAGVGLQREQRLEDEEVLRCFQLHVEGKVVAVMASSRKEKQLWVEGVNAVATGGLGGGGSGGASSAVRIS